MLSQNLVIVSDYILIIEQLLHTLDVRVEQGVMFCLRRLVFFGSKLYPKM